MENAVKNPGHYSTGNIQPIDFISDQKLNFNRGNVVKYVSRAGRKYPDKELEDLEKAAEYLRHEIEVLKSKLKQ